MGYRLQPISPARELVNDAGRLGVGRHLIFALVELDVTHIREKIEAHHQATGEKLSFTAFVVACLAQAIQRHPLAHAYRDWRRRLVIFDDVDVVVMVETERDGVALPHIVRAANHKTFQQIHEEIRQVQASPRRSPQRGGLRSLGPFVPWFLRRLVYWGLKLNPRKMKRIAGTTIVTSVGMFTSGAGWGLGFLPMHTMGLTLAGIAEKPVVIDGQVVIRQILHATLAFDHDIIDGAPAARFTASFKELVESPFSLEPINQNL